MFVSFLKTSKNLKLSFKNLKSHRLKLKDNINGESNDFSLKLNPGRPNLDEIFRNVSNETKGKVDVYYCGNVQLGEMIETKCVQYKYKFAKEYF